MSRLSSTVVESTQDDTISVVDTVLSLDDATKAVASPKAGATSLFVGTTRNHFEGKPVVRLEYEAYVPMAVKEIRKVIEAARDRWDLIRVAVYHRTGVVPVGESSIIIAASSAHRKEAMNAVQFLIDTIKASVPIWKKEIYEDGTKWKANKEATARRSQDDDDAGDGG